MTRVTAPIAKLTRSLSTTAAAPRPSHLLNASKTAAARVRQELEQNVDGRSSDSSSITTTRGIASSHRPTPSPTRTIPLMQTFHSSPGSSARADTSSIDFAVLPSSAQLYAQPEDSFTHMRVPLLPDNYHPDRSKLAPEQPDLPLPEPEIRVVAADPAKVLPAALTEVEGMGVDGVELKWAHEPVASASGEHAEGGMLRDLWKGLVDDVFGETKAKPAV